MALQSSTVSMRKDLLIIKKGNDIVSSSHVTCSAATIYISSPKLQLLIRIISYHYFNLTNSFLLSYEETALLGLKILSSIINTYYLATFN